MEQILEYVLQLSPVVAVAASWFSLKNDVKNLKENDANRSQSIEKKFDELKKNEHERNEEIGEKFKELKEDVKHLKENHLTHINLEIKDIMILVTQLSGTIKEIENRLNRKYNN